MTAPMTREERRKLPAMHRMDTAIDALIADAVAIGYALADDGIGQPVGEVQGFYIASTRRKKRALIERIRRYGRSGGKR